MPTAKDIMTADVITTTSNQSIKELSELFVKHRINGVPVVDGNGEVIGVVTQGDLIEQQKNLHIPTVIALFDAVLFMESAKKFEEEAKKLTGKTVNDIYHRNPITVTPSTEVNEVATLMAEKDVHTVPVVSGGKLVGIIGKLDVIKGIE
tara:strand:- start:156 stop:602 length:447 start_codon:yes stop_codon:yes gene_type:complete